MALVRLRSGAVVWWYISQTHTTLSVLGWLEQERQTARAWWRSRRRRQKRRLRNTDRFTYIYSCDTGGRRWSNWFESCSSWRTTNILVCLPFAFPHRPLPRCVPSRSSASLTVTSDISELSAHLNKTLFFIRLALCRLW